MLNIGKLGSDAAEYYIGEIATSAEDYYTGRGEAQGRWVGSLARKLGLSGAVEPEQFRAVLAGRHPFTHEQLARRRGCARTAVRGHPNQPSLFDEDALDVTRVASRLRLTVGRVRQLLWAGARVEPTSRPERYLCGTKIPWGSRYSWLVPRAEVERFEAEHRSTKTRPGYDITLRPPKSVSVLWALAPEAQRRAIRDVHREAVDAVVAHLERHAVYARQGTRDRARIETDGVIAAAFDHRTSRAGDPLLHTHVVTANLTLTAEGRWQAIDGRPLYEHARSAGFLYQAHLRHALSAALGVKWDRVRNGWTEIQGVPRAVIRAFSKRRDEIEEMIAESGYTSARAHQTATLASRRAKDYGVDGDALQTKWREEAAALGFGADEVAACFGHAEAARAPDREGAFLSLAGPDGLTRHASSFSRADVVEALSQTLMSAPAGTIDRLADDFIASSLVLALAPEPSTPESVVRRDLTRRRAAEFARYSTPQLVEIERQLIACAENGFGPLVPMAAPAAVEAAIARRPELSVEQVAMVRGVCLPGADAVQAIAGRPGSGKTHATAACVEAFVESGVPVVGCALSATAAAELESATQLGRRTGRPASTIARLLLDLREQSMPPGTVLVVDEASMVGSRDLATLAQHVAACGGAMKLIGDPDQHGSVESGGFFRLLTERRADRVITLEQNNRQVDANHRLAIEELRQGHGESALSRMDADGRVTRSATASQSYDAMVADWWQSYCAGERVPMIAGPNSIRAALNRRARSLLRAEGGLDGQRLVAAEREYCLGEWVVARKNAPRLKSPDGRFVKNGSAGLVVGVDTDRRTLTVRFDRDGVITLPSWYLDSGFVDYGYARTTFGVQGATLARGLYYANDDSSFEEAYVALTRGRLDVQIYIVDGTSTFDDDTAHPGHEPEQSGLDTVARAIERRRANTLALERDGSAADVLQEFYGWDLARLRHERDRLEAILADAPRDVSDALRQANRRRDGLAARRQAWNLTDGGTRSSRTRELERISKGLDQLDESILRLRARHLERRDFFKANADVVERHGLVVRAEQARELQVRTGARALFPDQLVAVLGTQPEDPMSRQTWDHAAGSVAVHLERYGAIAVDDEDALASLLGAPPRDGLARWSYTLTLDAVRASNDVQMDAAPEVAPV